MCAILVKRLVVPGVAFLVGVGVGLVVGASVAWVLCLEMLAILAFAPMVPVP